MNVNGVTYQIKDGFTIKEELNETLDSGTIQFVTYGKEFDAEPFDYANITFQEGNNASSKRFLIDSTTDDIYCFGNTLATSDHLYTMTLFSETKDLERITLPSCSITQPIGSGGNQITIWNAIQKFIPYIPDVRLGDSTTFNVQKKFLIANRVETKFQNTICPEFQWDTPTLREVLNDLMSVLDCIVIVKNGVIDYFDLSARGNAINTSKLSRMTSTISASDYAPELTMNMKNGVGKSKTISYRYQCCRTTDESGEITTKNMAITTQKPIYSVKKLVIHYIDSNGYHHSLDVANHVLEYDAWRLKPYFNLNTYNVNLYNHRCAYLYYKRGGYSIENISTQYKKGSLNDFETFLSFWYYEKCQDISELNRQQADMFHISLKTEPRTIFYEIEYETLYEHALHFGKNEKCHHTQNRVFDNQENAYIDIQRQSIFEYAKVNRLSNQIKEIYGEYESESEIPGLGDYIGDYILFSREISYYDDKLLFRGFLTKNYVLKDFFTGVQAKKRSWQIASQNESFSKVEIIKYYVEASFHRKKDSIQTLLVINQSGHGDGLIFDLTYVKDVTNDVVGNSNILNKVIIQTHSNGQYYPNSENGVVLDSDIEILGNSLCWSFGFEDNYKASDYMVKNDSLYTQNFYPYADDYGKFDDIYIYIMYEIPDYLVDENDDPYSLPTPYEDGGNETISEANVTTILEQLRSKPLAKIPGLGIEAYGFNISHLYHEKDTREIFKATVQFEYCSDDPNIIIKPRFLEYVRAVKSGTNRSQFDVLLWISRYKTYNVSSTNPDGRAFVKDYIDYSDIDSQSIMVGFDEEHVAANYIPVADVKSWCITDGNGKIMLAVNGNKPIYFNLLAIRDDKIYKSDRSGEVTGTIAH